MAWPPAIESIRKRTRLSLDVHLMVVEPERYIETFVHAGADLLTVHLEACPHLNRTLNQIREAGAKAGVALNPPRPRPRPSSGCWTTSTSSWSCRSTRASAASPSSIPSSYAKVRQIASLVGRRPIEVSVDGGVNRDKAGALAQAVRELRSASDVLK